jgi:ectoine hydroxylase-related dioxygenase (phytanoyl-CoA dioxygenase family)
MKDEFEALKKDFDENGFVIVPDVLDAETLFVLRESMEKVTRGVDSLAPELAGKIFFERQHVKNNPQWYEGVLTPEACGDAVRQISDLVLFDTAFADLICQARLLDVLENLFESAEFSFNMMSGRPKAARVGNGIGNGAFHRDTPFEDLTEANAIIAILCLDEMSGENGGTEFVRASHKITEEEARQRDWAEVPRDEFAPEKIVVAKCPAGSAIFFDTKILHSAGHNRSNNSRRMILTEWTGENALPTSPVRYAFQGLKPRSRQASYVKQIKMAFPHL